MEFNRRDVYVLYFMIILITTRAYIYNYPYVSHVKHCLRFKYYSILMF